MADPTVFELAEAGLYNTPITARFTEAGQALGLDEFTRRVGDFQEEHGGLQVDWKYGPATDAAAYEQVIAYRQNPNQSGWGQWFDSILTFPQDAERGGTAGGGSGGGTTGSGRTSGNGSAGGGSAGRGAAGGGGGRVEPDAPVDPVQPTPPKKKGFGLLGGLGLLVGGGLTLGALFAPGDGKPKKKRTKRKKRRG